MPTWQVGRDGIRADLVPPGDSLPSVDPAHPVCTLVAFVDDSFDDGLVGSLKAAVQRIAGAHQWVLGPPQFYDERDEEGAREIGCFLRLYTAHSSWGSRLPSEVDRAHLEDVKTLVAALTQLSHETQISIGIELDHESVGWIDGGEPDDLLTVGFLREWEARHSTE